jgi:hypothetical protein
MTISEYKVHILVVHTKHCQLLNKACHGHLPITAIRQARHPAIHYMRPFVLTLSYHAGGAHAASIRGAILGTLGYLNKASSEIGLHQMLQFFGFSCCSVYKVGA